MEDKGKKFEWLKKLVIVLCIAMISLIPSFIDKHISLADSGFGSSYDSGGSSYSGGSYDSGSSSWDYDSDYDSDGGEYSIVGFIIVLVIIVIVTIYSAKNNQNTTMKTDNVNDENVANKVKQYIPNFNKQEFLNNGYQIYKNVQNAWMNFKLDDVKDVITDELYNMYDSQLSTLEVKGEKNIMKDFKLVKSYLKDVNVQNETITITTGYIIEMYDYIIEESTGKVLRGSSTNKLRIVYEMKFRQTLNSNGKVDHCPNCGAKIEMNSSGTCEYCGSKLVSENTKWVLTEKKTMRQEMF